MKASRIASRYLVGQLVGVPHRDGFGGEQSSRHEALLVWNPGSRRGELWTAGTGTGKPAAPEPVRRGRRAQS